MPAEIQELPIVAEEPQEIEQAETKAEQEIEPLEPEPLEPEPLEPPEPPELKPTKPTRAKAPAKPPAKVPAPKPKGRPKGSKTRPPPIVPPPPEPELPAYVQEHIQPQPQDVAAALMGLLQSHERERRDRRTAKYSAWVQGF